METRYPEIYALARLYLDTRHNDIHTRIAFSFALKLLETEGGDERVVLPAVILHDVGWKFVPEDKQLQAFGPRSIDVRLNRIHEVEGSKKAREILREVNYDPDLIEEIAEIILGHDSRQEALSLNDAIVKDSDKLWRYSNQSLEIDPPRFGITPEMYTKLVTHQIDIWLFTETAKKLAREEQSRRTQR